MSNKKKVIIGSTAIASIAGIGLYLKKFIKSNDDKNKETKDEKDIHLKIESPQLPSGYDGIDIPLTEYYQKLLNELPEPKLVYKHFMTCLMTPRPSHKLDKMREALKESAKLLKVEYTQDEVGNVCLKKAASKGYENAKGVVIQCHMDMVCTKTEESKMNFDSDGIEAYIDGHYLKANKTTLGADDGIGIAAGLALMEHPNLIHGPIELLITVDEESTMGGAKGLAKAPFLCNKIMINVDSEESSKICIGCAGGFKKHFFVNMKRDIIQNGDKYRVFCLNICGLLGGHTGIQINLGRANAIKLLCRMLNYLVLDRHFGLQLIDISGGNAQNAIPSYSKCTIVIEETKSVLFEKSVNEYWQTVQSEFKDIENKMQLECNEINDFLFKDVKVCEVKSTNILIALMMNLPHGVVRMSPKVGGLVQTSIAFTQLELAKDSKKVVCGLKARSMSMNEMLQLNRKLDSFMNLFGNETIVEVSECLSLYPGWDPVLSSPALNACKDAHVALFGKCADVYAVHAGLECGLIKNIYPEMDCVSIGPTIHDAHSTDERLDMRTVPTFYNWLVETVVRIAKAQ